MKTLASVAFGAVALTAASVGLAEPASARTNVGVYISPYGFGVTLNPNYCSDYWYRQNHWNYCAQYDGYYDNGAWPFFGGFYSGYRVRHFDHNRHHDNNWGGNDHRGGDHRHH